MNGGQPVLLLSGTSMSDASFNCESDSKPHVEIERFVFVYVFNRCIVLEKIAGSRLSIYADGICYVVLDSCRCIYRSLRFVNADVFTLRRFFLVRQYVFGFCFSVDTFFYSSSSRQIQVPSLVSPDGVGAFER